MIFMLYPWYVRRACHAAARSQALRLTGGAVSLLIGAGLIATGLLALR
jgi:Tfp pilus assembly protein PilN